MFRLSFAGARIAAPVALVYNIAAQIYGVAGAKPSIADVHNANLSYFSPEPILIAVAFSAVMVLQAWWLSKVVRLNPSEPGDRISLDADILPYMPFNIIGNLCIGTWAFFWTTSHLAVADAFILVNTLAHLAYIFLLQAPVRPSSALSRLTRVTVETFAALGVLDTLHNSSIAFAVGQPPGAAVAVLTALGFVALTAAADWILGVALVFDLVAIAAGQARYAAGWGWSALLLAYAVVCAALTHGKEKFMPQFLAKRRGQLGGEYERLAPGGTDEWA